MIKREEINEVLSGYKGASIGILGSHSALDVCEGAKQENVKNLVVCRKGREKTYDKYYKANGERGVVDETIVLEKFKHIADKEVAGKLREKNVIFVPHRSFAVYVGYDRIENEFEVPIFGNRGLLRAEERDVENNQYDLLDKAGVRKPRMFKNKDEIDALALVKCQEAKRSYERAFFFAKDEDEYESKSKKMLKEGLITEEGLKSAPIEEFVLGAQYNFNFFYSPLSGELELMGVDTRRQTNLDGILKIPAKEQKELAKHVRTSNIEIGHIASTIKESMLEKVFQEGEKFIECCKREYSPGIIGPFALQGAVVPEEKGEEIVIFDVSFRMPGSPGTRFTPYSGYLFRENMSIGRRVAKEIKDANDEKRLEEIST